MQDPEANRISPPRIQLALTPTPLQPLTRFSEELGVDLWIKRDDLTGTVLSGNKVRKLEFVLAEAIEQDADVVLTCGGAQSNHARATAVAAARLGMRSRLLLRTNDPKNPPKLTGNLLLDHLAGAELRWITPDQYEERDRLLEKEAESLRSAGARPYVIPEGASNSLGVWGYIRASEELARDLQRLPEPDKPATLVHACGSGGTAAGLILGALLYGSGIRVISVNVCDDADYFRRVIEDLCRKAIRRFGIKVPFEPEKDLHLLDGYVGRGYALSRPDELHLIRKVARREGLFLDPVYTGKAFFGMVQELRKDPACFGPRVIFLHTGGLFGVFAQAEDWEEIGDRP